MPLQDSNILRGVQMGAVRAVGTRGCRQSVHKAGVHQSEGYGWESTVGTSERSHVAFMTI